MTTGLHNTTAMIVKVVAVALLWSLALAASAQTVRYIHADSLGSVAVVTDQSRNVIERREYEPYGRQLTPAVKDGPGYTGHVQDAATGLTYMQQRYYDPIIGRFLSVDPVTANSRTGANFNRYWYANNNPYKFTDPDGRQSLLRSLIQPRPPITQLSTRSGRSDESGSNDGDIDGDGRADGRSSGGGPRPIADRPLPRSKGGEPAPDPEAEGVAHTQLGKSEGRKVGEYPSAREFDDKGKPVRDIDFTDHGRPKEHTNPHQHPYRDNPTGGTRQRGEAMPLDPGYPEPLDPGDPPPMRWE